MEEFYLLRSSKAFSKIWQDFLPTTAPPVKPVLYQHLTDSMFKSLLHEHFKVEYLDKEAEEINKQSTEITIAGDTVSEKLHHIMFTCMYPKVVIYSYH